MMTESKRNSSSVTETGKMRASSISVPSDILAQQINGQLVLLNLENEIYYGLDEVGARMWHFLIAEESIGDAISQMISEYEARPEEIESDMIRLVDKLREKGLLVVRHSP